MGKKGIRWKRKKSHDYEGQIKSVRQFYYEIEYVTDEIAERKKKRKQLEEVKKKAV